MAFIGVLKIIGIILLTVLALLLVLLLLLLFVPFRYKAAGSLHELKPDGSVRVSWLLHIVSAELSLHEGVKLLTVRLFGFRILRKELGSEDEAEF